MTILYEVKTGHTKKVLKAFARLYNENRKESKKIMFQYVILAVCLFMLPRAFKMPGYGYVICWGLGILVVILALARDYLTYLGLLRQDKYYIEGTEILMSFGYSAFSVQDDEKKTYKYHLIRDMYVDNDIYYLHLEDDDLFLIPKGDFVKGTADDFCKFMQCATGKTFEEVGSSFMRRLFGTKKKLSRVEKNGNPDIEEIR